MLKLLPPSRRATFLPNLTAFGTPSTQKYAPSNCEAPRTGSLMEVRGCSDPMTAPCAATLFSTADDSEPLVWKTYWPFLIRGAIESETFSICGSGVVMKTAPASICVRFFHFTTSGSVSISRLIFAGKGRVFVTSWETSKPVRLRAIANAPPILPAPMMQISVTPSIYHGRSQSGRERAADRMDPSKAAVRTLVVGIDTCQHDGKKLQLRIRKLRYRRS